MKKLVFFNFFVFVLSASVFAQLKSDIAGNIIKQSEEQIHAPLTVKDFSFQPTNSNNGISGVLRTQPGAAFFSSAIIPGSAQAANGKWIRAGAYLAVEAFSIFYYVNRNNTAKDQERRYQAYANSEWSVVAYSQWLVNYYDNNPGLSNPRLEELRNMVSGLSPDFTNTTNDWDRVNIKLVQEIERNTELICPNCNGGNFSHVLPAYGSQQYYELISKYYQFEGGWSDFYAQNVVDNNPDYNYQYDIKGAFASDLFLQGASRADQFNTNYRRAGNILNLLVINHVVSAFDALFSVKLKNAQLQASADMMRADSFSLTLHF